MTRLIFRTASGPVTLESDEAISVMQLAKNNGVEGIDADCGGQMVCGTCHVLVEEADLAAFPPPEDMEEMILENVPDPQRNARLSCQLKVQDCPDGAQFTVPLAQR